MSYLLFLFLSILVSIIPASITSYLIFNFLISFVSKSNEVGLGGIGFAPAMLVAMVVLTLIYTPIIFKLMSKARGKLVQMPLFVKILISLILLAIIIYVALVFQYGYPVRLP